MRVFTQRDIYGVLFGASSFTAHHGDCNIVARLERTHQLLDLARLGYGLAVDGSNGVFGLQLAVGCGTVDHLMDNHARGPAQVVHRRNRGGGLRGHKRPSVVLLDFLRA